MWLIVAKYSISLFITILYDIHFFLSSFSLTNTDNSRDSRGREDHFTLPLRPIHEHLKEFI